MAAEPPFRRPGPGAEQRGSSYSGEDRSAEAPEGFPESPPCPFCEGVDTELMNAFGAHASVSSFWCRACRSPFEMMRWRGGAG